MCGIAGFNWPDEELITRSGKLISHRGPDAEGYFIDENVSLGFKRLSIIDLSTAGHQPMFYTDANGACSKFHNSQFLEGADLGIIFNGEIYNFQEIKTELISKGYHFSSKSDTEVILASYLEWGQNCVTRFNGMWAFCIYDKKKGILFLSRDRMGQKPLFYYSSDDKFIFGSEIKTILQAGIERNINTSSLNHYLFFGFNPTRESMLKGVNKVLPGHTMVYDLKKKQITSHTPYWQIKFTLAVADESTLRKSIHETIDQSVKRRLIADVPVGAFLSGGLDSSIMVYHMRKYIADLKTFSIKFDYADFDESKWSNKVSSFFKTDHYEIQFTAKDVLKFIPDLVNAYDNPLGDPSIIPTFLVSKVAREHVTVSLSGMGGDELFGGYTRYSEYLILKRLIRLSPSVKSLLPIVYKLINRDKSGKLKELLKITDEADLYLRLFSHLSRNSKEIDINYDAFSSLKTYFSHRDGLTNMLNFDQHTYLPDNGLEKEDRATMANSLEGRAPFMDYHVVNLANSIPWHLKIRNGTGKYILKKAYHNYLPHEIIYRKKQGFGVPLNHYFRNELKDITYDAIFDFQGYEYYDKKILLNLWDQHQKSTSDYSQLFWLIFIFNKWYEKWM
jgi:asparagine synthase (glutamine-hydrolysing)